MVGLTGEGRMDARSRDEIDEVLRVWLDEVGPKGWYAPAQAVDEDITARFGEVWARAGRGECENWMLTPRGALALLIVLDQFPRNMFRGTAEAYRSDEQARATAKLAIHRGYDRAIPEPERQFFYLPLMHSEVLSDQDRSVRLILMRLPETGRDNLKHAIKHREVIRRFGRFPSRNAVLGRRDTAAERAYRESGGYMSGAGGSPASA